MTGTPLDLTPFGPLLQGLGLLYWVVAIGLVALALWLPRKRSDKIGAALAVGVLIVLPLFVWPVWNRVQQGKSAQSEYQQRLAVATARFEAHCKKAGEFVKRRVEGVEGVVWMKWRDPPGPVDTEDQFKLFDPFGRDCDPQECIANLLRLEPQGGRFAEEIELRKGRFGYVETIDPRDGQKYRYVGAMKPRPSWTPEGIEAYRKEKGRDLHDDAHWFTPSRERIEQYSARYGITWDDISTREDREHWIAGGSLRIVDLQTDEVIAERVGYMMDRGLGSRAGHRQPWAFATDHACPPFAKTAAGTTYMSQRSDRFVFDVLRP